MPIIWAGIAETSAAAEAMKTLSRSFTLVELLVVCGIISILAAISTSNLLEAQTRAKVSRVKADMRTMVTAVESYAVDHSKYPIRHHRWEWGDRALQYGASAMVHHAPGTEKIYDPDWEERFAAVGLHVVTTPVAYLTALPCDVFNLPAKYAGALRGSFHYG